MSTLDTLLAMDAMARRHGAGLHPALRAAIAARSAPDMAPRAAIPNAHVTEPDASPVRRRPSCDTIDGERRDRATLDPSF